METLRIDTSQNIDIEQSIASLGERVTATLLDLLFLSVYLGVLAIISGQLGSKTLMLIGSIPISLYSIVSEVTMNGQSWGKKIMKIKVVKIDGTPTSFSSYFMRWIIRLVDILVTFGSLATITIILNQKGQRLGDIAGNTTVIRLRDKSLKETIYTSIPEDYTLIYPEVAKLSINDIYTLKEVLELLKSPDKTSPRLTIAKKTQEALEQKLGIQSKQNIIDFFQTILQDYNFIHSR